MTDPVPVLELEGVSKTYPARGALLGRGRGQVHALTDVSLALWPGEVLGVVGESGCGKSTLGRVALRLVDPTSGCIRHEGRDITALRGRELRAARRRMQMVFQDPFASFDPLSPVASSVAEPLVAAGGSGGAEARRARLLELVEMVQLRPDHLDRYPPQLSGGQLQRLGIARALATDPSIVVLDEPVSSLDVSTQAQVLNLLADLQRELGVSYLLIAHNPALVRHASHRIAVMYLGEVVEIGAADAVYERPRHPYTDALLSAVLVPDPAVQRTRRRVKLSGELSVANAAAPPPGCRFHPRCPHAMDICRTTPPPPFPTDDGTMVRCHLHEHGPKLGGSPVSLLATRERANGRGPGERIEEAAG